MLFGFYSLPSIISVSFHYFVYFGFAFLVEGFPQISGEPWLSVHIHN